MPGPAMYVMLAMACLLVVVMYSGMAVRPRTNAEPPPPRRRVVRALPPRARARAWGCPLPTATAAQPSLSRLSPLFPRPPPRSQYMCYQGGRPSCLRRAPAEGADDDDDPEYRALDDDDDMPAPEPAGPPGGGGEPAEEQDEVELASFGGS